MDAGRRIVDAMNNINPEYVMNSADPVDVMNNINPESGLPLRESGRTHKRIIIGHHLILHGYGHWFPNDPRGSGSREVRKNELRDLGSVHFGRKKIQPPRTELKAFMREGQPRLSHSTVWFDEQLRRQIGDSFAQVISQRGYTVWACAVLKNHAHFCVRRHRDSGRAIWNSLASGTRQCLAQTEFLSTDHPLWSDRPYSVFLYAPADIERTIAYINANPEKEGLLRQQWPFVKPYDG